MNCLEFRRSIMIEPDTAETKLLVHANECKACASFMREQQDFEHDLRNVTMMPVPEQLASRILLHQGTEANRQLAHQRRWLATAVSMTLAVAVIMNFEPQTIPVAVEQQAMLESVESQVIPAPVGQQAMLVSVESQAIPVSVGQQARPVSIEQLVLTHIHGEIQHLEAQLNIQPPELDEVLAAVGVTISTPVGQVNYAGGCTIRNKEQGAHLVLQGEQGPVTVLLMPAEIVASRIHVQDERFYGVIFPAEHGSVAVIGEKGELIEAVEQRINAAVGYIS